jgi:hypothetical protein
MNTITNGRVDIKTPDTSNLFQMYDRIPANQCTTYRDATEGLWVETPLSQLFFSKENVQILQNGIRAGVYKRSNGQYIIGQQDCDALKIIMRSVYLQHSSNQIQNISQQINQLNKMILDYCIQQVYGEAQGYLKYIDDASTLVIPLAPPVMTSNTDKELFFKGWF